MQKMRLRRLGCTTQVDMERWDKSPQPKGRADPAGGSRRAISLSSPGASSRQPSDLLRAPAPASKQTREGSSALDRASSREEEIFGDSSMPGSPAEATASASANGGSNMPAGEIKADAASVHGREQRVQPGTGPPGQIDSAADLAAEAPNELREFSDSDDSLILDEIRPASPILKGGNTWLAQAEEPLSTASSLSKSGASSLLAIAGNPVPPSKSIAAGVGAKAGSGDATASKPQSYSWKLGAKTAPAKQGLTKDLRSIPTQSAAISQNPTGAGNPYRWQLQNAGSKAQQQGTEMRTVISEQQKAAAVPKNLTWRRTSPATASGHQATAHHITPPHRPLQQPAHSNEGSGRGAEAPPWLTQASATRPSGSQRQESPVSLQPGAMTESERHVACAGQINPMWQATTRTFPLHQVHSALRKLPQTRAACSLSPDRLARERAGYGKVASQDLLIVTCWADHGSLWVQYMAWRCSACCMGFPSKLALLQHLSLHQHCHFAKLIVQFAYGMIVPSSRSFSKHESEVTKVSAGIESSIYNFQQSLEKLTSSNTKGFLCNTTRQSLCGADMQVEIRSL